MHFFMNSEELSCFCCGSWLTFNVFCDLKERKNSFFLLTGGISFTNHHFEIDYIFLNWFKINYFTYIKKEVSSVYQNYTWYQKRREEQGKKLHIKTTIINELKSATYYSTWIIILQENLWCSGIIYCSWRLFLSTFVLSCVLHIIFKSMMLKLSWKTHYSNLMFNSSRYT